MRQTGFELRAVQKGLNPSDWKPIRTIGPDVREIRIHAENEYRTIYVATFTDAVYVLHCFAKKSWNTPRSDIEIAKQRLKEARRLRRKAR
ncbi:MAG: type II toxin-antitoxin system RelE/ParE family toxin [Gammaproteobacteria bacterium]|nr:type II toxin-antitoxin system RelE/ParE family toxin [Gammaproteobacteria bacterium]